MKQLKTLIAIGGVLILAACAPGGPSAGEQSSTAKSQGQQLTGKITDAGLADLGDVTTADGTILWASGDSLTSYNYLQADNYSTYNAYAFERISQSFNYRGTDGELYPNTEFGTYEKISEDPLQVKYTISEQAAWSDGTPVTAADYIFKWAVQNPETKDAEGNTVFKPVSTSFGEQVPGGIESEAWNSKEFTITFPQQYADWEILVDAITPAHIVAQQSGMDYQELVEAARNKDGEKLKAAADFWNTGWNFTNKLGDLSLYPSIGPYKIDSFTPNESLTLVANENYWGTPPATKTLTIRMADPKTHVQALSNRDVHAIEPHSTVDTLNQLNALGDSVVVHQYPTMTYEHLDFNFTGGVFKDNEALREAFAQCVPRQQIVDNLIKPTYPEATVLNSRGEFFSFQDDYDDAVSSFYDGSYDDVNLDEARTLVEKSGVVKPKVRIGYSKPNSRRTDTVALIKESCDQAGFDIVDAGSEKFFDPGGDLHAGNYDVALFAWSGSGQIVSGRNISSTTGKQNYGKFSDPEVDKVWDKLAATVDPQEQKELKKEVEKLLWKNLFSLPLYEHPGLAANVADLANVRANSTQAGLTWNVHQWLFQAQ